MRYIIFLFAISCSLYPDNPAEELIEQEIRDLTGIDIDLTSTDGK